MYSNLDNHFATFQIESDRAQKRAVRDEQLLRAGGPKVSVLKSRGSQENRVYLRSATLAGSVIRLLRRPAHAHITPSLHSDG